jgi:signal transduction histidine kinase
LKTVLRYGFCLWISIQGFYLVQGQDLETLFRMEQSSRQVENREALILLSDYYTKQGAYAKAFEYWDKCANLEIKTVGFTQISTAYGAAEALYRGAQYQQAINNYAALLKRFKNNEDSTLQYTAWLHCIDSHEKIGQYKEAFDKYSALITHFSISKNPSAFTSLLNHMGVLEKKSDNLTNAYDYFTNARVVIEKDSKRIPIGLQQEVYSNLAVTHAANGEYITSLSYFQKAEELQPMEPLTKAHILNLKGATYYLMNRYEDTEKVAVEATTLVERKLTSIRAQQILADSYELLANLYKDRDWPTYQSYNGKYLGQREKVSSLLQIEEEKKLRQSIEIEKKESELRAKIAADDRLANESRQRALEGESAKRNLELKVRELELQKQNENVQRFQLEKQLLIRKQAEQGLLLEKERLERSNQQKELDRQELIRQREQQELNLVRSQKQLSDQQLADEQESSRFVVYIALLVGAVFFLSLVGIVFLLRNHRKLVLSNQLIVRQKDEIENQVAGLENAQAIIESQNQMLKTYNETLELQVEERTQQLVETNKEITQNNQQLEQYSYMTAHNLRGPVARLLGLTAIFGKLGDGGDREIIDKIQKESLSLDTLIRDLNKILQVRKASEELRTSILLDSSVKQAIQILEPDIKEANASIVMDFTKVSSLMFVPTYFENIIYNLISNAIKYRHPDKALVIRITSFEESNYIGMRVSDNGMGIDMEKNKDKIFGLYKRFHFHKDGKGIGLYLIKAQIETMGGKIKLESEVNVGTEFTLLFPKEGLKKTG